MTVSSTSRAISAVSELLVMLCSAPVYMAHKDDQTSVHVTGSC